MLPASGWATCNFNELTGLEKLYVVASSHNSSSSRCFPNYKFSVEGNPVAATHWKFRLYF